VSENELGFYNAVSNLTQTHIRSFQNSNYPKNNRKYFPLTKLFADNSIFTQDQTVFTVPLKTVTIWIGPFNNSAYTIRRRRY
jgi:hypothetical protein